MTLSLQTLDPRSIYPCVSSLFADKPEDQFLLLAAFANNGYKKFFRTKSLEEATEIAIRESQRNYNVYYGVGTQARDLGSTLKGETKDITALNCVFLDVDVLDLVAHAATNLPPTCETARQVIDLFPFKPTFLIWSGHGWQALWLFREWWLLSSEEEQKRARALLKRFQRFFRRRAQQQWNWHVDPTANLDRLLRMPGTVNWKNPERPIMAEIVEQTEERLDPREIEEWLDQHEVSMGEEEAFAWKPGTADLGQIEQKCAFMRACRDNAATLSEPWWYAQLGIIARCKDGERLAHKRSESYTYYSHEETASKLQHALTAAGPRTCASIRRELGAEASCARCSYWGKVKSPISLGLSLQDDSDEYKERSQGGLIMRLASAILAEDVFAQDASGKLFFYQNGVYHPRGDHHIRRRVKNLLAQWSESHLWTSHKADEVVVYLHTDAPLLWDRPPLDTLNVLNGLLNVSTKELRPHSAAWLSTIQVPIRYDPTAKCPSWDKFIKQTFPKDAQRLAFEIPADLMLPDRSQHKAILLIGEGGNGKSAYLAALMSFIGRANSASLSLQKIEADRFAAARLAGKLANICSDLPNAHLAGTSVFKAITGGDRITGEHKYHDSFEFAPFARLLFSANRLPRSGDDSEGFFQRWFVVPFERTFRGSKKEISRTTLDALLADPHELSGVLNKALAVLPQLRKRGFTESESMRQAREEFRQATDPLAIWLEKNILEHPDAFVSKEALWVAYNTACERDGRPRLTQQAFGRALKRLRPALQDGQRAIAGKEKTWAWLGIGLKTSDPPPADPPPSKDFRQASASSTQSEDSRDSRDSSNCL